MDSLKSLQDHCDAIKELGITKSDLVSCRDRYEIDFEDVIKNYSKRSLYRYKIIGLLEFKKLIEWTVYITEKQWELYELVWNHK